MADTVERRRARVNRRPPARPPGPIERGLYLVARARLQRVAEEVPPVSVERFAADHGVTLPDWVDAEARAVEVRFGAIGLRRRGYAGFYAPTGRGRLAKWGRRPHIVLNVALRCEPREVRAEVFLHELAHIIAGLGEHHGPRWAALAQALGIQNASRRGGTLAIALAPSDASAYERANLTDAPLAEGRGEPAQGNLFA